MTKLSISPVAADDGRIGGFLDRQCRRVEAMPPGMCPLAQQLTLLEEGALQTCGKCVPCRDGLPQLAAMLRHLVNCEADAAEVARMRSLAEMVRDTSDCAIGYEAANALIEGLDTFAKEVESHLTDHACRAGVQQSVPCETFCPAHVNVPAYIALVAAGDNAGAVQMIRKDNPFPTACGLVCEHPCEKRCRRTLIDAPLNIRGIKEYACEHARADQVPVPARAPQTGRRVAVVGGGPSGLTCAYFCALMGHEVDVFEERKQLGGMIRYGIPAYRFPRERLDEDINGILAVGGITVHTESPVDAARMAQLSAEYDAVYVAIGAQTGKGLRIDGTDANGVFSAVDLLGRIGDGDYPDFTGKKVAVIGGGNVAMDCCRTAVRAGAEEVSVVYRRRISDMTALPAEIESAIAEGVEMITLQAPAAIEKDAEGNVAALLTDPQMIGPVKRGRPAPVAADKPQMRIPADVILIAVGQNIVSAPFEEFGMAAEWGEFKADDQLHAQMDAEALAARGADPLTGGNVFVGGDCQTGPASAIKAIAAGKVAARNIDDMLGFNHTLDCGVTVPPAQPNDRAAYGRVEVLERPARERKGDFEAVEVPMSTEEAMQECGRCLRCDHFGAGACEGGASSMPNITINGQALEAREGQTILEVAREAGIHIPTLCYLAERSAIGSCRVCVVEVEGQAAPVPACTTRVVDGMVVQTDTERVQQYRRMAVDLLISNHGLDSTDYCFSCVKNGACELQAVAREVGVAHPTFPVALTRKPVLDSNPFLRFDPNLCITCQRCVGACNDAARNHVLKTAKRGVRTTIAAPFGPDWDATECESCGNCAQACPTGALVEKRRGLYREWDTHTVRTTCPHCGVGCQFDLVVKGDQIVDVEAADGPSNVGLLCVKGRSGSFDFVNSSDRITTPLVKNPETGQFEPADWDTALDLVARRFAELRDTHGGESIAAFACSRSTNEDIYMLQKMARCVFNTNNVDNCARV